MLPLLCRLKANLLLDCVKLIGYLASAVSVASFNPFDAPSSRTKMTLFYLSIYIDEPISAPKIINFLLTRHWVNESSERE